MKLRDTTQRTFSSLANPNYKKYFFGQATSLVGTWMQTTAQAWLVLTLTHSATALGLVIAVQTLPVLLLGPYGGVIADRVDKRRLMIVLQSFMGLQAAVLAALLINVHPGRPVAEGEAGAAAASSDAADVRDGTEAPVVSPEY